jgi:hypothetical protein
VPGSPGGTGAGGRVKVLYLKDASNTYASATSDGSSPPIAPSGPISGTGYKESL